MGSLRSQSRMSFVLDEGKVMPEERYRRCRLKVRVVCQKVLIVGF